MAGHAGTGRLDASDRFRRTPGYDRVSLASSPPFADAAAREPRTGRRAPTSAVVATRIVFAAIVAMLTISAMALIEFGVPYASSGGNLLTKIHPATYVAVIGTLTFALSQGGLGRWAARLAIDNPGVIAFAIAVVLLFVHVVVVQKLPMSAIVDAFVLPILMFATLGAMDAAARGRIADFLHLFLAVNAVIGLVEYGSGWRVTPMRDIDGSIIWDWRSTALLGHPLNNAFVTGCWLVMLAAGAAPRLGTLTRLAAMALAATALVAFGGRVAMVFSFMLVVVIAGLGVLRLLAGRRFSLTAAAVGVAAATAFTVAAVVLIDAGAADRLVERFVDDSGSAGTRIAMFRIFGDLSWGEFLLGPPPDHMIQAQRDFGIRIGIESTEVAFVAFYGLVMAVLILAGLAAFLAELVRLTGAAGLWPIVFFVVTMSAATGLASKSTNLAIFTVMMATMMPRPAGGPRADGRRPADQPGFAFIPPRPRAIRVFRRHSRHER